VLTLYQAEWCPYSSAVREILTELGQDFVAKQVEPRPELRDTLRSVAGVDTIPVLTTDDGQVLRGAREIFRYLESLPAWEHADAHRQRYVDHEEARVSGATGKLIVRFRRDRPGDPIDAAPHELEVVDNQEESRYELRQGDRLVGLAAYSRNGNLIAFTHTEVDAVCEGRGYGSRLVRAALEDARSQGLSILPLCSFVAAYVQRHPELATA
jgi:uncharacterized protein